MGDTSQHTFQNQENTIISGIQVSILLDEAIHRHSWVIQVNILFKKTQLCRCSVIPMGDTSQHTCQNQENKTMPVIEVSILLDEVIQ